MKYAFSLLIASALMFSACAPDDTPKYMLPESVKPVVKPEEEEQEEKIPENPENMPVMGGRTMYKVDVEELSGLCLSADKSHLLACGDQGVVKKISFTGEVSDFWYHDADMEGITIDPATGHIYIAVEGSQKVYRLDAPDYKTYSTIFYVKEAVDKRYDNSGLEGIDYYKDDIIFIGSQWGANLWQYKLDGTMISKVSLSSFADEIAGLCYDSVGDWLWVVDSNYARMYICTVEGELLATYSLNGISNAESICVDRDRNCVWIGSDESSPKLYKYSFKF